MGLVWPKNIALTNSLYTILVQNDKVCISNNGLA